MEVTGGDYFRVSIFGSSRLAEHTSEYQAIKQLGSLLAAEGISIITGGGPGLMEAANAGHMEGRKDEITHSLGLTIATEDNLQLFNVDICKNSETVSERLHQFLNYSHAIVIAPGGVGTLLEFFYVWQLIQLGQSRKIPLVMFGEQWNGLFDWIKSYPLQNKLLNVDDLDYIHFVQDCSEVVKIVTLAKIKYDQELLIPNR